MSNLFCVAPCAIDTVVGKKLNWKPEFVTVLRGKYELAHPERMKFDQDDAKYGVGGADIIKFYNNMQEESRRDLAQAVIGNVKTSYANAYKHINERYGAWQTSILTELFTGCIHSYQTLINRYSRDNNKDGLGIDSLIYRAIEQHPELGARLNHITNKNVLSNNIALYDYVHAEILSEAISKNYIDIEEFFGQINLLVNRLFSDIVNDENTADDIKEAIGKYFSDGAFSFASFLWMAKDSLKKRSSITIGKRGKFIEADSVEEKELLETTVKDGWMNRLDSENPYDKASTAFKIFLSTVPVMTLVDGPNGKKVAIPVGNVATDLMYTYNDSGALHAKIVRACRNARTPSEVIKALRNSNNPTLMYVADAVEADEILMNSLFADLDKVPQSYIGITIRKFRNAASKVFRNVYNGVFNRNTLFNFSSNVLKAIKRGKTDNKLLIFGLSNSRSSLVVDSAKCSSFVEYIRGNLLIKENTVRFNSSDSGTPVEVQIASFIKTALSSYLGINISRSAIKALAEEQPALFKSLMINLSNIATRIDALNKENNLTYTSLLEDDSTSPFFSRLFSIVEEAEGVSSMVIRVQKSNYAIDTQANELGRAIADIRSFVQRATTGGENVETVLRDLKGYIISNYLQSEEYYSEDENGEIDVIYNDIINNLYYTEVGDLLDEGSFINQFIRSGQRLLTVKDGYRTLLAEDMNEKQNILAYLQEYFSQLPDTTHTTEGLFANYGMFTMGDSQVIKSMRQRAYTEDELKTQYVNVALQELKRMNLEFLARKNLKYRVGDDQVADSGQNIDTSTITVSANNKSSDNENVGAICSGNFVYLKALNEFKSELQKAYEAEGIDGFSEKVKSLLFGDENSEALLKKEFTNDFWSHLNPLENGEHSSLLETAQIEDEVSSDKTTVFKNFPDISYESVFTTDSENPQTIIDYGNPFYMYYLNSKLALIQQFQFYKKSPDAYTAIDSSGKLSPSSVIFQKRLKAENTPGIHCNVLATWNGERVSKDGIERAMYLKEFKKHIKDTDPKMWECLKNRWGEEDGRLSEYGKTKTTDGQGWRTLTSFRKMKIMTKGWNDRLEAIYNEVTRYRKQIADIRKKGNLTESDDHEIALIIDEINELCADNFQVVKPHNSSTEIIKVGDDINNSASLCVPVEHKYAEAILIPELYDTSSILYSLGNFMEANDIDLACSEECVKVGNWGSTDLQYVTDVDGFYGKDLDENGRYTTRYRTVKEAKAAGIEVEEATSFEDRLNKAIIHKISYSGYEIQTETPQHLDVPQLVGTQMRKQMFASLLQSGSYDLFSKTIGTKITKFTVAGEEFDLSNEENGAVQLTNLYNALVCNKMLGSFLDLVDSVTDPDTLSDILSTLKSKDDMSTPSSIIKYAINNNGNFTVPLCEFTQSYDNEGYFMSLFKKKVSKQKVRGGSYVQVSDLGLGDDLRTHFDTEGNPTYDDCVVTWDLSVNIDGKETPLKFSDWCRSDGTLKGSGTYINESTGEKFTGEAVEKNCFDSEGNLKDGFAELALIEVEYPGILDRVAYRIPTERMYSILNLKVKRFLPKCCGGVIAVPSYRITSAGFDFDIDKLYYFKREYNVTKKYETTKERTPELDQLLNDLWAEVYNSYPEVFEGKRRTFGDILGIVKDREVKEYNSKMTEFYDENGRPDSVKVKDRAEYKKKREQFEKDNDIVRPEETLYSYWDKAGLHGTYQNAFDAYLEGHPEASQKLKDLQTRIVYEVKTPNLNNTDITRLDDVSLNNLFIDVVQSRINSKESFDARYTPGGFVNDALAAKKMKAIMFGGDKYKGKLDRLNKDAEEDNLPDYEPIYDPTNPYTAAIYNARNIIASKVIGIAANHNTNFAYSQTMKSFKLKIPITLFGRSADDLIHAEGADLWLAEILASSVDAVKAPVLNFLNITTYTANIAALMSRVGYSGFEVGLFLNQPIIKEVCNYMSDGGRTNITSACKAIMTRYTGNTKAKLNPQMTELSEQQLFDQLYESDNSTQINVLNAFALIAEQAQALSEFIDQTKYTAANSIDNRLSSLIASKFEIDNAATRTETKISEYLEIDLGIDGTTQKSPILKSHFEDYSGSKIGLMKNKRAYFKFLMKTPFALEQIMHDCIDAYYDIVCEYFPYNTDLFKGIYSIVNNSAIYGYIDADMINVINSNLPVYLLSEEEGGLFNPNTPIWYNKDSGEFTHKDMSGNSNYLCLASQKYYSREFNKKVAEFIDDLNDYRDICQEYDSLCYEYTNAKANNASESVINDLTNRGLISWETLERARTQIANKYPLWIADESSVDALSRNIFIQNLDYSESSISEIVNGIPKEYSTYSLRLTNNAQFEKNFKSSTSDSWGELFELVPSLAVGIYMSNYFERGFDVGTNVFNNITPVSILEALFTNSDVIVGDENRSYIEWVNCLKEGTLIGNNQFKINRFLTLLYRANYGNNKFVKSIDGLKLSSKGSKGSVSFTDNNGSTLAIDEHNGDCLTITATGSDQALSNSVFAITGGRIDAKRFRVIPAFTANVTEGEKTVKYLYVLSNVSDNVASNNSTLQYNRISIPQEGDLKAFSYNGKDIQTFAEDDATLDKVLESLTQLSKAGTEYSNTPSVLSRNRANRSGLFGKKGLIADPKAVKGTPNVEHMLRKGEELAKKNNSC